VGEGVTSSRRGGTVVVKLVVFFVVGFSMFAFRHLSRAGVAAAAGTGLFLSSPFHSSSAACHGSHAHDDRIDQLEKKLANMAGQLEAQFGVSQTSGQGDFVFSWEQELTAKFPEEARPFEKDMHGGFNENAKTGVVYTGIPGAGLFAISPDLATWTRLGTDERLKANIHGLVVFEHKGQTLIACAQNEQARVLLLSLDGEVLQQLDAPKGGEFNFDEANGYYSKNPRKGCPWHEVQGLSGGPDFAVTDVTYCPENGRLYCVTGYCDGDFVLSASMGDDGRWAWGPVAWGGKGDGAAQFQTAHGVFAHEGHIFVANREAHQVLEFTPEGQLVRMLGDIPAGARICNVARAGEHGYFVMNALEPIQHTPAKTAAVYAHDGEKLVSTIEPGTLGVPILKHLHHVWPHYTTDEKGQKQLYILVHGWSQGKFAVLKHEPGAAPTVPNGWNRSPVDGTLSPTGVKW